MAQVNPNIYDVAYTRPGARGQSAARLVRYLTRRPDDKERPGPESRWRSLPDEQVFGDPEAFKEEANRRRRERLERHERNGTNMEQDHSPQNVSYVHVVISPRGREAFRDEDFGALIAPWVRDRKGRPCAYMGAVHYDDPEGPKLHLAIARDRVHKAKELPQLKDRTAELIRERQMLLECERNPEQVQERDHQPDHEAQREEATMQNRQREEEAREAEEMQQRHQAEEAQRREDTRSEGERQVGEVRGERDWREELARRRTERPERSDRKDRDYERDADPS